MPTIKLSSRISEEQKEQTRLALARVKGLRKLNQILREMNLSNTVFSHWMRDGVLPGEHAVALERLTGGLVTRQELRPDLYR